MFLIWFILCLYQTRSYTDLQHPCLSLCSFFPLIEQDLSGVTQLVSGLTFSSCPLVTSLVTAVSCDEVRSLMFTKEVGPVSSWVNLAHTPDPALLLPSWRQSFVLTHRQKEKQSLSWGHNTMPYSRHPMNLIQAYKVKIQTNHMLCGILNSKTKWLQK